MIDRSRPALPRTLLCAMLLLGMQSLETLILPHIAPRGVVRGIGIALGLATVAAFALALAGMMRRRGKPRTALAQGPLTTPAPQANEVP